MDTLLIKNHTRQRLYRHCTPQLLEAVFCEFGYENIAVDNHDACDDVWEIGDFVYTSYPDKLLDRLKVIFVFSCIGGTLRFDGHDIAFSVLFKLLRRNEPGMVLSFWTQNKLNGFETVFDVGELAMPDAPDRCSGLQNSETMNLN